MKTPTLLALAVVLVAGSWISPSVNAAEDELDRGIFKALYSPETKRAEMQPISLKEMQRVPSAFMNVYARMTVRFNRVESGSIFVPEFTLFDPEDYLNFSVWDVSADLWLENEMKRDCPFLFVDKDTEAAQHLLRLGRFDIIEVYGVVKSLFENKPWFEVLRIELKEKSDLTSTLFAHIRLVEDMFEKGVYDLAIAEIDRIFNYEISDEVKGMLYKRRGESLLHLHKYAEAEATFVEAEAIRPQDGQICKGWAEALMGSGNYESAISQFERSLVFEARQADVYAKKGYCRAKIADAMLLDREVYEAPKDPKAKAGLEASPKYAPGMIKEKISDSRIEAILAHYEESLLD
ncbi:MAG: tetratricopeptide repeat protein, partial [Planctomycetes bacterium]|nr:tetratricopeptide repeat protein [Planctomycetota bacterium]